MKWDKSNAHALNLDRSNARGPQDKDQTQASALDLSYFTSKSKCKYIKLIHSTKQNHLLMFVKNYKQNGFKMPLNMKNINNSTQCKNGSVDVTFEARSLTKSTSRSSGRSTRSAVDIFNRGFARRVTHLYAHDFALRFPFRNLLRLQLNVPMMALSSGGDVGWEALTRWLKSFLSYL